MFENMTAEELRAGASKRDRMAAESFERSDTDGFLTQHCHGLVADLMRTKAEILENGGKSTFCGLYEGDRRVAAKLVRTKYGTTWMLRYDERERFGRSFVPTGAKSPRVLVKLGLKERTEVSPAFAVLVGEGRGLSGSAWVQVFPSPENEWGLKSELVPD